jgi:small GTP-binding protein
MNLENRRFKVVIVGNPKIGKTSVLLTFSNGKYVNTIYPPPRLDELQQVKDIVVADFACRATLTLWDTSSQPEYDRLRPLAYPRTDIFLIAFSVVDPESFDSVRSKWLPELQLHDPNSTALRVLVGTRCDQRHDIATLDQLNSKNMQPISKNQATTLATEIGCDYVECSSTQYINIDELFSQAVTKLLIEQSKQRRTMSNNCLLL